MNGVIWFFIYTPLPWFVVTYIVAYRHDLGRVVRPFRDHAGPGRWWSVCAYLSLINAEAVEQPKRAMGSKSLLTALIMVSLNLILIILYSPLEWYFLSLLQAASSLVLFLVLANRIGPLPAKPFCDVLPYPRLGTRIRHLRRLRGTRK